MKINPIWKNLTHVREDYIEEASPDHAKAVKADLLRQKRIRNRLIGWGSLAACLVIVAGAIFPLWKQALNLPTEDDAYAHYPLRNENDFWEQYPCLAVLPTFPYNMDGNICTMQYPTIVWQEQEHYVATNSRDNTNFLISPDDLGEELGKVTANTYTVFDGTAIPVNFTLYRIQGIDETIAFAVSYEGGENYVVYRSTHISEADSWSELVERVDLQTNLTTSPYIFHTVTDKNGKEVRLVFEGMTAEILWNELLADGKLVDYSGEDSNYLRISINHTILNTQSVLCVTANGYITFGMIKTGKALYVGKDRVRAFVDYLEDHLTGYRLADPEEQNGVNQGAVEVAPAQTVSTVTSAAPPYTPNPQ